MAMRGRGRREDVVGALAMRVTQVHVRRGRCRRLGHMGGVSDAGNAGDGETCDRCDVRTQENQATRATWVTGTCGGGRVTRRRDTSSAEAQATRRRRVRVSDVSTGDTEMGRSVQPRNIHAEGESENGKGTMGQQRKGATEQMERRKLQFLPINKL